MKQKEKSRAAMWVSILACTVCVLAAVPLLSEARARTAAIRITNNSNLEVRHVYISPVGQDAWSSDQLNQQVIGTGQSYTVENVTCSGDSVKVITEDSNGCFLYNTVECSSTSQVTLTDAATPDCGG